MVDRTSIKFDSVSELSRIGMSLDPAVTTPVYYKHPVNGSILPIENNRAVFNMEEMKVASVVSDEYTLLEHRPIVEAYTHVLQSFSLGSFGTIHNYGNRMYIETAFGSRNIIDGVKLGVRLKNSYDKYSSFGLQAFGYRVACQNGMFLGQVLKKDVSINKMHVGKINIQETVNQFIKELVNSEQVLQQYISDSMKDSIEWSTAMAFLDAILNKKGATTCKLAISENLASGKISRWQLYNALTWYSTHQLVSDFAQDKIQSLAQKILVSPIQEVRY